AALLAATATVLAAFEGAVVVRAAPERGGLAVSVLADRAGDPAVLDEVPGRLAAVGGHVEVEPSYVEFWVPAQRCRAKA
ncbi:MAG: hypothetical protein HOV94_25405, partial [Saccharothrix sp.]|nr:hypothetical protein [Saccharothrix sp.]